MKILKCYIVLCYHVYLSDSVYAYGHMIMITYMSESKDKLCGIGFLILPCGLPRLKLDPQVWLQAPYQLNHLAFPVQYILTDTMCLATHFSVLL